MKVLAPADGHPPINSRVEAIKGALVLASDVSESDQRPYLVKGWFDKDATSLIYGASNAGKSFFALDLAFHIASGRHWNGFRVTQGNVVYVAAEGGRGFANRIRATRIARSSMFSAGEEYFSHLPLQLDLHADEDTRALLMVLKGWSVDILIVDTLAMSFGAGNENDGSDVSRFLSNISKLRQILGCHVLIVHHTGKDASKGARGHSSLRAAVDTEIELSAHGSLRSAKATKQRDLEAGKVVAFTLQSVKLYDDQDGDPVTSCVVEAQNASVLKKAKRKPLTGLLEVAFQALDDAMKEHGHSIPNHPDFPASRSLVTIDQWKQHYLRKRDGEAKPDSIAKDFGRKVQQLIDNDYVRKQDERVWFVNEEDTHTP